MIYWFAGTERDVAGYGALIWYWMTDLVRGRPTRWAFFSLQTLGPSAENEDGEALVAAVKGAMQPVSVE